MAAGARSPSIEKRSVDQIREPARGSSRTPRGQGHRAAGRSAQPARCRSATRSTSWLQDDSRLGGQITELTARSSSRSSRALDAALHAVLSGSNAARRALRAGELVTEHDDAALRDLVRAGEELSLGARRGRGPAQRASRARRSNAATSLPDQRSSSSQLEQVNQSSTVDMEIWHEEAHRLSTLIQRKLEGFAPVAKRMSVLRRYPELRERLAAGEGALSPASSAARLRSGAFRGPFGMLLRLARDFGASRRAQPCRPKFPNPTVDLDRQGRDRNRREPRHRRSHRASVRQARRQGRAFRAQARGPAERRRRHQGRRWRGHCNRMSRRP